MGMKMSRMLNLYLFSAKANYSSNLFTRGGCTIYFLKRTKKESLTCIGRCIKEKLSEQVFVSQLIVLVRSHLIGRLINFTVCANSCFPHNGCKANCKKEIFQLPKQIIFKCWIFFVLLFLY